VVAVDGERPGGGAEDLDLAGAVGLHPDGRGALVHVAEQRTQNQFGHIWHL